MKLLLIGQSVEDHIFYKGEESVKPGGMFYTASGILAVKDERDDILLVTSIDDSSYSLFEPVYSKTDTSMSVIGKDIIPLVRLDIYDDKERDEKYDRLGTNLPIQFDILKDLDGILINMITGFDITLEQLRNIRGSSDCPIFMDVHTLSRGVDADMKRPQRLIPGFSEWAEHIDILQVNDNEVFSLFDFKSEREIAAAVLASGTRYFLVTKGYKGVVIYYKRRDVIESVFVSAEKVQVKNKIGCGDIFGAVFFHSFLKFQDPILSLRLANTAAGLVSSYDNADDIGKLKNDVFSRHN